MSWSTPPRHLGLVALGRVRAQDNLLILRPLLCQRRPLHLSDGSASGSSLGGLLGGQPVQHECLRVATLDYATPLLPDDRVIGVGGCVPEVHAVEGRLVRLDIRPLLVLAKDNVLFLCLHPCLASMTQPLVKVLDHLVVDMKKTMGHRVVVEL